MDPIFFQCHIGETLGLHEELISGTRTCSDWEAERPTTKYHLKLPYFPARESKIWNALADDEGRELSGTERWLRDWWLRALEQRYLLDDSDDDAGKDVSKDNVYHDNPDANSQKPSGAPGPSASGDGASPPDDDIYIFGLPKDLLEAHGELAALMLLRAWDLKLALESKPCIFGVENTNLAGDPFTGALQQALLKCFYINLFRVQLENSITYWKEEDDRYQQCLRSNTPFESDMPSRNHDNLLMRIKGEEMFLGFMRDALQGHLFEGRLPYAQMGDEEWVDNRCDNLVQRYYDMGGEALPLDKKVAQVQMVKSLVMMIVAEWEPVLKGTKQPLLVADDLADILCETVLVARRRETGTDLLP